LALSKNNHYRKPVKEANILPVQLINILFVYGINYVYMPEEADMPKQSQDNKGHV